MACELLGGTEGKLLCILLFYIAMTKALTQKAKKLLQEEVKDKKEIDYIEKCIAKIR